MNITLTGADERTPVESLTALADRGAEIGLLYTHSPDGRKRYPEIAWIDAVAGILKGRVALHVCGVRARAELAGGVLDRLVKHVERIQVNGPMMRETVAAICRLYPQHTIITQHMPGNGDLFDLEYPNHALLVDGSGGRGIAPKHWCPPFAPLKPIGFAGGLSPATLPQQLPRIAAVAGFLPWIDLESGLRDEQDWFDVKLANDAVTIFEQWKAGNR
jgi:hypothetical protein